MIGNALAQDCVRRFEGRLGVVGVIGLGYVGQPLALCFAEGGSKVIGFDIDHRVVDLLNSGNSNIEHIDRSRLATSIQSGFEATTDYARAAEADALIICVPTPLNRNREPDMSYIRATMASLAPHLREGQLVSLESTTFPGTIDDEVIPVIAARGFTAGETIFVAYSPEREDPGNAIFSTRNIPKLVGGVTPVCTKVAQACYASAIDTLVPVSSTRVAELSKLLENIQRSVNIGLVNEMKIIADRMGIDIHEVIDAAATKPFGFTPYYPGPGLGGHCIPIDPFYLTWKAREFGVSTRFIELAGEINQGMPEWVFRKIGAALNDRQRAVRGSRILALGIAYKKNVDDMRESPAVQVMELLRSAGAVLDYSDPHVPVFPPMREHKFDLASVELTATSLALYDAVVLLTDHDAFDYDVVAAHAALIVDSRGKYRAPRPNVVKA
ncbi:MAG: nucleotide sugar dehydrogenase [Sphingomonadaceae bacterium]